MTHDQTTRAFDVESVLAQLTTAEKAQLTSGSGFWWTAPIERLGIPAITVSDGPHGLRTQRAEADHLGLGNSEPATAFPPAAASASSWNPTLLRAIGEAIGREARALGVSVVLGPGINIKRSPLCGRNFEYFSEDPVLGAEMAIGLIDGIQSQGVGTSLKHYAANNQETDRHRVSAVIDERTLREIYLSGFARVVAATQPWTVMSSYNKVNGTYVSESSYLLQDMLRDEFGFEGMVVSDWGGVYHRIPAILAGVDLEMPPLLPASPDAVVAAVEGGEVPMEVLDARARAVLTLVSRGAHVVDLDETVDFAAHHALARTAAAESIVLLRNENGLLPLARGTKVAVIGEFARTPRFQGGGSSQVNTTQVDAALPFLQDALDVTFAPGFSFDPTTPAEETARLRDEAVAAAQGVDTVVLFLGLTEAEESEGFDRTHMNLPAPQLALLSALAQANPQIATVLVNGSSVILGDVVAHSTAVVESWLTGQAGGSAVVDVLLGEVNPSGRLAETIPHRLQDNSAYLNFPGEAEEVRYGEGLFVGYRGYDAADLDVAFPFGFGLSYTTFALSDLSVTMSGNAADGTLAASVDVTVTNTGDRGGAHVVQVYVQDPVSRAVRPVRELAGFTKVEVPPGGAVRASIPLDQRAFSYYSVELHRFVVEAGEFVIEVGAHSRDLPLRVAVEVDAPSVLPPLTLNSLISDWTSDPAVLERLRQVAPNVVAQVGPDNPIGFLLQGMPLSMLASFMPDFDAEAILQAARG
ncbi:MAG: glycoside hydrolase family 3 C-terminal domain-containing protein [Phycicoccus sp.]|nr:glycoside hydrolase family 3 C-terminal domain-containing protein [Phycicoccus sp.]